jgi:hypothetical protein
MRRLTRIILARTVLARTALARTVLARTRNPRTRTNRERERKLSLLRIAPYSALLLSPPKAKQEADDMSIELGVQEGVEYLRSLHDVRVSAPPFEFMAF